MSLINASKGSYLGMKQLWTFWNYTFYCRLPDRDHLFTTRVVVIKRHKENERGESTGSKIMFSLSSLFFFGITKTLGVDSCVFLIFTTRVGLKTRLNGVKSIRFEQCRKF